MKFSDLENAVKHIIKTNTCPHCRGQYAQGDINVILTTKLEGLFEIHCNKCHISSIMTVVLSPKIEIKKKDLKDIQEITENSIGTVSENDILDIKNFLNNFDGNFKKLFTNEK